MMDYKQMAEIVTKEVDAILERKRRRAIMVKRVSLSASGLCAAGIVGLGVWRNDKIKNAIHNDDPSVITEISENTTTEKTVLTTVNTTETTDIVKTTSVNNTTTKTSSAKAETSEVKTDSINTSTSEKNTIVTIPSDNVLTTTTKNTSDVNEEKTQTTNSIEITDIHTTTATTEQITESTTQTTSIELCEIFNNIVFTFSNFDAAVSNEPESQELYYINDTVEKEELSGLFRNESLYKQYFNGEKLIDIETYAELYSIQDYSLDVMLAVKFDDSDKYYRYINKSYHPSSIGDFIYSFSLTANDLSNEIYLNEQFLTDCDTKKAWELLTADLSLPNKTTYCQNNDIVPNNSLLLRFESSSKTWLKGSIGVDLRGYIWITINDILTNSFYIGDKKANEIFEYYN